MSKQRLQYMDLAKGVGIILVVIGHSTYASDSVLTWLAGFHMPLFFIISGMLLFLGKESERSFKEILIKKGKGILLPYATFSILTILINSVFYALFMGGFSFDKIIPNIIETVTFYGISVLWFLPALFLGEILFLAVLKKFKTKGVMIVGILFGIIVIAGTPVFKANFPIEQNLAFQCIGNIITVLLRSMAGYVFLAIGYLLKRFIKDTGIFSIKEAGLGAALLIGQFFLGRWNGRVDLHFLVFNHGIIYFLGAAMGTLGVVFLCKNISCISIKGKVLEGRWLAYFGKNSLIIMATHLDFLVMLVSIKIALWLNQYVPRAKEYVLYLTMAVCLVIMELVLIYVFNHYLYRLIGKSVKGKKFS